MDESKSTNAGRLVSLTLLTILLFSSLTCSWFQTYISCAFVWFPFLSLSDWRVDVETSSGHLSRMSVPVCLLSMTLQPPSTQVGIVPQTTSTKLEINQQELTTLLNGLEKIQQQLAGMK